MIKSNNKHISESYIKGARERLSKLQLIKFEMESFLDKVNASIAEIKENIKNSLKDYED